VDGERAASLAALADRLGYRFTDPSLLDRALAHRSWCAEHPGTPSNERLEFLGDAVLGWVIADIVYHRFDELPEGSLTDLRKSVVSAVALADVAALVGLGPDILLGRGERAAGGAEKPSILSDALEAVLAAVYLDGGPAAVHGVIERWIAPRLLTSVEHLERLDHKTELQELAARRDVAPPEYRITSSGPDHAKRFVADVVVGDRVLGSGAGRSKKAAEQAAARVAVEALRSP
jgi:ribonuclease-3